MFAKDQNNGLNNFSLGIKHICYTECKHVSLSVLNLKLIRYDGFVLHPLQVFLKIFRNIYLCRQTLTWKWFSRLKIRAFLVQYTSMMMHRAKTTNDVHVLYM